MFIEHGYCSGCGCGGQSNRIAASMIVQPRGRERCESGPPAEGVIVRDWDVPRRKAPRAQGSDERELM